MKKKLLFFLLLTSTGIATAQQLYLEGGKTISTLNYKNSQGEKLDNLQSTDNDFMAIGYRFNLITSAKVKGFAGLSYTGYGAIGSDDVVGNFFEWNFNYLNLDAGFDLPVYSTKKSSFYVKMNASFGFMVRGVQTLNNEVINLEGFEEFDKPLIGGRLGLGFSHVITEKLSFYLQYMYGHNLILNMKPEELSFKSNNVGFGLIVDISKSNASSSNIDETQLAKNTQLESLREEVEANSKKIKELEANSKKADLLEEELKSIKRGVQKALNPYEGTDLKLEERNDKVYIALQNDVIFNTGSSELSKEGLKTISDLGVVLSSNPDLSVLVEGHTDNVPFVDSNISNRDLSLKRASLVVEILCQNKNINPKNITAVGKGEFFPKEDNSTEEGRAKNRRIEIVLEPKFKELIDLTKN